MVDIDDFKKVNDVFGHAVGDEVLAELADHLRATGPRRPTSSAGSAARSSP